MAVIVVCAFGLVGSCLLAFQAVGYLFPVLCILLFYFLFWQTYQFIESREKEKNADVLIKLLSDLRHQYYRCGNVAESVYYAALTNTGKARKHLDLIYAFLSENDHNNIVKKYKEKVQENFYRMLFMMTVLVEENGDEKGEGRHGESVFLWCLGNLRREVEENRRNEQKMRYLLNGLNFVITVPVFALPYIRNWALESLPELSTFYEGWKGRIFELITLVVAFYMFRGLLILRGRESNNFLLNLAVRTERMKIMSQLVSRYEKYHTAELQKREEELHRIGALYSGRQIFVARIISVLFSEVIGILLFLIMKRYDEISMLWWIAIQPVVPILGYWYPILRLKTENWLRMEQREKEILRFHFLIRMEMRLPGISTKELLEHMYEQAFVFKESLLTTVRDFDLGEREALMQLWNREKFPPFRRVIDMFLMVDENGMKDAFDELETETEEYRENRRIETEIIQQGKSEAAIILSCIPGGIVMFGYLIVPFISECFRMLQSYNDFSGMVP